MSDTIPDKLLALLNKSAYSGSVLNAYRDFMPLLGNNNTGLFFFPEYTDHGPEHIRGVLASIESLIHETAWPLLTPNDGVLIALSVLLHDAAMVLTADGFLKLLASTQPPAARDLDNATWADLFDEFYDQARRWDGQTLHRILGDQLENVAHNRAGDKKRDTGSPVDLIQDVIHIRDRQHPDSWSIRYRKFLGEFIRRHHARLAHEIALVGFPGNALDNHHRILSASPELTELAGFIARSHSFGLRSAYSYLDKRFDSHVICRGTHPLYLMVMLRIA
jgi:molecular chaperone HtpG